MALPEQRHAGSVVQMVACVLATCLVAALCLLQTEAAGEGSGDKAGLKHFDSIFSLPIDDADPSTIVLTRLDGVEVGHTKSVRVKYEEGNSPKARSRTLQLKTLSMEPLVFEIQHFLTSLECKQLRELAIESGLGESQFDDGPRNENGDDQFRELPTKEDIDDRFVELDANEDRKVDLEELQRVFHKFHDAFLPLEEVEMLLRMLDLDKNDDAVLSRDEFDHVDLRRVVDYVRDYRQKTPASRHRHSDQATVHDDYSVDITKAIRSRVATVTEIPKRFVSKSESLQVVRYAPGGHYHCHVDSDDLSKEKEEAEEDDDDDGAAAGTLECCHVYLQADSPCRRCRYATVMFYLTDGTVGGETAFTAAGVPGINQNYTAQEELYNIAGKCNLTAHCTAAGLTVKPERGKALLWYNHLPPTLDSRTMSTVGQLDHSTIHGGCHVTRGEKWIANMWINYELYHRNPPANYHQNWGLEGEDEAPKSPSYQKILFDDIVHGRKAKPGEPGFCGQGAPGPRGEMAQEESYQAQPGESGSCSSPDNPAMGASVGSPEDALSDFR